jgi:hypothetical protein
MDQRSNCLVWVAHVPQCAFRPAKQGQRLNTFMCPIRSYSLSGLHTACTVCGLRSISYTAQYSMTLGPRIRIMVTVSARCAGARCITRRDLTLSGTCAGDTNDAPGLDQTCEQSYLDWIKMPNPPLFD